MQFRAKEAESGQRLSRTQAAGDWSARLRKDGLRSTYVAYERLTGPDGVGALGEIVRFLGVDAPVALNSSVLPLHKSSCRQRVATRTAPRG